MLPIKHSTIFKSRWWALLWAAGICWTAVEVAQGAGDGGGNAAANASAASPDGGDDQPVSPDAAKQAMQILKGWG